MVGVMAGNRRVIGAGCSGFTTAKRRKDGSRERVDALIHATGYRLSFPFLSAADEALHRGRDLASQRRAA
jgi:lysine/ornithine N-monooxygenase